MRPTTAPATRSRWVAELRLAVGVVAEPRAAVAERRPAVAERRPAPAHDAAARPGADRAGRPGRRAGSAAQEMARSPAPSLPLGLGRRRWNGGGRRAGARRREGCRHRSDLAALAGRIDLRDGQPVALDDEVRGLAQLARIDE